MAAHQDENNQYANWSDNSNEISDNDISRQVLIVDRLSVIVQKDKICRPLLHELSFSINEGETLALIGESGSGKSITASAIAGLMPNGVRIGGGNILFQGESIVDWPEKKKRQWRGRQIGWIFQDYQGSFSPFFPLGRQLSVIIRTHLKQLSYREAKELALTWLDKVALPPERTYTSYPFQLSGGQQQRVSLAAALMLKPALLIADEPTTALDALTGERVLELMSELQQQTGCAMLLISHDLRQVMKRAHRILVMKEGRIVESGDAVNIREHTKHPYTRQLLVSCPKLRNPAESVPK
ncbi:ABC transporter ATP-binding protein [Paenibacillus sp. ACRRX]|uniref:ATP-binding cassette domain-containing protein n=1 Tax=Paenibacillus sp. ACRRX TaxID=2918206 RepID=UPI001EF47D9C|nr:ABC transporter ATP-binding protein [Paenibacillus sp. ACRRX]MCG7407012.1 ABC transporter ATP-binding protein [Paenibacillus sp. ACRRX]